MLTKAQQKLNLLSFAKPMFANAGFLPASANTFVKNEHDLQFSLSLIYAGSLPVEATILLGFVIKRADQRLKAISNAIGNDYLNSPYMPTVFQKLDLMERAIGTDSHIIPIDCLGDVAHYLSLTIDRVRTLQQSFKSEQDIAYYAMLDQRLPLGHHALRVPILLNDLGRSDDFNVYVGRVLDTGFIRDYRRFIDLVLAQDE